MGKKSKRRSQTQSRQPGKANEPPPLATVDDDSVMRIDDARNLHPFSMKTPFVTDALVPYLVDTDKYHQMTPVEYNFKNSDISLVRTANLPNAVIARAWEDRNFDLGLGYAIAMAYEGEVLELCHQRGIMCQTCGDSPITNIMHAVSTTGLYPKSAYEVNEAAAPMACDKKECMTRQKQEFDELFEKLGQALTMVKERIR